MNCTISQTYQNHSFILYLQFEFLMLSIILKNDCSINAPLFLEKIKVPQAPQHFNNGTNCN